MKVILTYFKNLPIRLKLISIIMSVALLVLFSGVSLLYVFMVKNVEHTMKEQAKLNMKIFGELSAPSMVFDSPDDAKLSLNKFSNVENVIFAGLYNLDGELFAKYERDIDVDKSMIIELSQKITYIDVVEGHITLRLSTKEITDLKRSFALGLIVMVIILLFIAYILAEKLQQLISMPVLKLVDTMESIAAGGHFENKVEKYADDELGSLYDGFNAMMFQLRNQKNELLNLNKTLEKRVTQRTNELQVSLDTLKETQEQMIESEKMAALGGLVAGVAHEINTPVGLSVTGITHLKDMTVDLKKLYDDNNMSQGEFERYLETSVELNDSIYINLKRAAKLVQSFKKVAADQSIEGVYTFNFHERLDQVLISLRSRLKHTNIEVKVDCDENLEINSDPGSIVQIFTNLITNSLMHAFTKNEKGIIKIKVFKENEKTHINYADSGKGIEEDVLPKIFDPFFTTNRKAGGTGLGLHIIYNIITGQLGGTIKASSVLGEGVLFEIVL